MANEQICLLGTSQQLGNRCASASLLRQSLHQFRCIRCKTYSTRENQRQEIVMLNIKNPLLVLLNFKAFMTLLTIREGTVFFDIYPNNIFCFDGLAVKAFVLQRLNTHFNSDFIAHSGNNSAKKWISRWLMSV